MKRPNPHAQALGRLAKGIRKRLTPAERERRRAQLARVRKRRWRKPAKHKSGCPN
jgi:hypothetical protein